MVFRSLTAYAADPNEARPEATSPYRVGCTRLHKLTIERCFVSPGAVFSSSASALCTRRIALVLVRNSLQHLIDGGQAVQSAVEQHPSVLRKVGVLYNPNRIVAHLAPVPLGASGVPRKTGSWGRDRHPSLALGLDLFRLSGQAGGEIPSPVPR